MKTLIVLPILTLMIGFLYTGWPEWNGADAAISGSLIEMIDFPSDTTDFDQEKALEILRKEIEGKEELPSSQVFKNIKVFKQVPAGRLLRIMEMGFGRSLGVNCTHCHNPKDFGSEEKDQKQIARDMMEMVGKINGELLTQINNLNSDQPTVNCTTCHRGQVKPALNIDN